MTHYLNDDEWWTDSLGVKHAISDMTADYARNIYNLLISKAKAVSANYSVHLANVPMPNGEMAFDQIEQHVNGEIAAMADNVHLWLTNTPLMQALMWRMSIQPSTYSCWCGHADSDHITPNDDPRPLCVGCTRRPIGTRAVPAEAFHQMAELRPSADELEANSLGVRYDDAFKARKAKQRADEAHRIRQQASKHTGLAANRVLDSPIPEYDPVPAEEGDEFKVFVVSTGYYSDFRIDSVFVGDRNAAHHREWLLTLQGYSTAEVADYPDECRSRINPPQLADDPEELVARYRTRVNADGGGIIDMNAEVKTTRRSFIEPTSTTVTRITPTTATGRGWRHEVEISTTGPVSDIERIKKSHSERVAFVRAALIEGHPFEQLDG